MIWLIIVCGRSASHSFVRPIHDCGVRFASLPMIGLELKKWIYSASASSLSPLFVVFLAKVSKLIFFATQAVFFAGAVKAFEHTLTVWKVGQAI